MIFPEFIRIDEDEYGNIELLDEDGHKSKLYIGGDEKINGAVLMSAMHKDIFIKLVRMILENGLSDIKQY